MTTERAESWIETANQKRSVMGHDEFRREQQVQWKRLLGGCDVAKRASATVTKIQTVGNMRVESVLLTTSAGMRIPLLWMLPTLDKPRESDGTGKSAHPPVICVCSQGKSRFLKDRAAEIARLLNDGVPVCLVDPRGIGESKLGDSHGRRSSATSLSSSALMLSTLLLGQQLSDLRTTLSWLREQPEAKGRPLELWGESLIEPNAESAHFRQPRDDDSALPAPSEPQAPLLALLAGLFEDDVTAIQTRGGLASWKPLLMSHLVLVSHAAIVPDVLSSGDIAHLISAQRPETNLRTMTNVDGWNRVISDDAAKHQSVR